MRPRPSNATETRLHAETKFQVPRRRSSREGTVKYTQGGNELKKAIDAIEGRPSIGCLRSRKVVNLCQARRTIQTPVLVMFQLGRLIFDANGDQRRLSIHHVGYVVPSLFEGFVFFINRRPLHLRSYELLFHLRHLLFQCPVLVVHHEILLHDTLDLTL